MPRSLDRLITSLFIIAVLVPSGARAQLLGPDPQLIKLSLPATTTAVVGQTFTIPVTALFTSVSGGPSTTRRETTLAWYAGNPMVFQPTPSNSTLFAGMTSGTAEMVAISEGRTTVRVVVGSVEANATVVVVAPSAGATTPPTSSAVPARLGVTPPSGTLLVARALQLTATVWSATNAVLTGRAIAWSSTAPAIASVTTNGLVTAIAPGTATIRATDGAVGSSAVIVVQSAPPVGTPTTPAVESVAMVSVGPAEATIKVGLSLRMSATVRAATGATLTGRVVTWTSSAPAIGRVSSDGQVTAVAPGTATITATSEGKQGSATITVIRVTRTDP